MLVSLYRLKRQCRGEQEIVKAIENINHKMDQSAIETANNNTIEKSAKKLHELLENLKQ